MKGREALAGATEGRGRGAEGGVVGVGCDKGIDGGGLTSDTV